MYSLVCATVKSGRNFLNYKASFSTMKKEVTGSAENL